MGYSVSTSTTATLSNFYAQSGDSLKTLCPEKSDGIAEFRIEAILNVAVVLAN